MKKYFEEEFLSVKQLAKELNLGIIQIRGMINFVDGTCNSKAFPNAYKATLSKNSQIRIPLSDIEAFKKERAGTIKIEGVEELVYDLPFMKITEVAKKLQVSKHQVRMMLKFDASIDGPCDGSAFPHAYKATLPTAEKNKTNPIRIPSIDVDRYINSRFSDNN